MRDLRKLRQRIKTEGEWTERQDKEGNVEKNKVDENYFLKHLK